MCMYLSEWECLCIRVLECVSKHLSLCLSVADEEICV